MTTELPKPKPINLPMEVRKYLHDKMVQVESVQSELQDSMMADWESDLEDMTPSDMDSPKGQAIQYRIDLLQIVCDDLETAAMYLKRLCSGPTDE